MASIIVTNWVITDILIKMVIALNSNSIAFTSYSSIPFRRPYSWGSCSSSNIYPVIIKVFKVVIRIITGVIMVIKVIKYYTFNLIIPHLLVIIAAMVIIIVNVATDGYHFQISPVIFMLKSEAFRVFNSCFNC